MFKPNPLVGSFVVGDSFFVARFDNPLPTRRAASHRARCPGPGRPR